MVKSKTSKGYSAGEAGVVFDSPELNNRVTGLAPQLLVELMKESELEQYLNDDNYFMQEKQDGERRMTRKDSKETIGINKKGLSIALPSHISNDIKEESVLDSESMGETLRVFDIRSYKGENIEGLRYEDRLDILDEVELGESLSIVYTAKTLDEKKALLKELQGRNSEGVVFKHKDHVYEEGRPNSGGFVFKYKFYKTATVRVLSHTEGKRSVSMEMLKEHEPHYVGRVTIPVNKEIPEVGKYIEVRYLYAYKGGSLYQPTYLGERNDQDESDIGLKQLVYKPKLT